MAEFDDVWDSYSAMPGVDRRQVVDDLMLRQKGWPNFSEPEKREYAIRLVCLYPESQSAIEQSLASGYLELHFCIFCWLDSLIEHVEGDPETREWVKDLMLGYITCATDDGDSASWMAGDLVGAHLPTDDGLWILARCLDTGLKDAGATAVIQAIREIVPRLTESQYSTLIASLPVDVSAHNPLCEGLRVLALPAQKPRKWRH